MGRNICIHIPVFLKNPTTTDIPLTPYLPIITIILPHHLLLLIILPITMIIITRWGTGPATTWIITTLIIVQLKGRTIPIKRNE